MSNPVEITRFETWKNSSRGLLARPVLPSNIIALREHIESVDFAVYNMAGPTLVDNGALVVANVMLAALAPWPHDDVGHSFLWPAPGSLWAAAGTFRIIVTFTTKPAYGSLGFIQVWEADSKDPTAP